MSFDKMHVCFNSFVKGFSIQKEYCEELQTRLH